MNFWEVVEGIEVRPICQHNFWNNIKQDTKRTKAGTNSRFAALDNVKSLNVAVNNYSVNIHSVLIGSARLLNESETHN